MGVSYDDMGSELISESERGIWKAGKRCPDLLLQRPEEDHPRRLYSRIDYGRYLVLAVGNERKHETSWGGIATHFELLPEDSVVKDDSGTTFTSELVSTEDKFTVVVRPDMYIGFVGEGDGWMDYIREVFVDTNT